MIWYVWIGPSLMHFSKLFCGTDAVYLGALFDWQSFWMLAMNEHFSNWFSLLYLKKFRNIYHYPCWLPYTSLYSKFLEKSIFHWFQGNKTTFASVKGPLRCHIGIGTTGKLKFQNIRAEALFHCTCTLSLMCIKTCWAVL